MTAQTRTYGAWRERRGYGLAGLSGPQTTASLAVVVSLLLAGLVSPSILLWLSAPIAAVGALMLVRVEGRTAASGIARRAAWGYGRRRGWGRHDGLLSATFPAPLDDVALVQTGDPAGRPVGLLWAARSKQMTGFIAVEPVGIGLVDGEDVQQWQRNWAAWLAGLGHVPGLLRVAVTVATGAKDAVEVTGGTDAEPPAIASEVMAWAETDSRTADRQRVDTLVAVSVRAGSEHDHAKLVDLLTGLSGGLAGCGVGVLDPVSPTEVVGWVRAGFEPHWDHRGVGSDRWLDARPSALHESWDSVRHDGWLSAAYVWDQCPGPDLGPQSLTRLLGPCAYPKRVCIVFEPIPERRAALEAERQTQAAVFRREYRRRLGRDESAREMVDLERARRAATEQAVGAGLVDVGVYAVVSGRDEADLAAVAADLEHRAGHARLRLRRAYGSQAATFTTALGVGYLPRR